MPAWAAATGQPKKGAQSIFLDVEKTAVPFNFEYEMGGKMTIIKPKISSYSLKCPQ